MAVLFIGIADSSWRGESLPIAHPIGRGKNRQRRWRPAAQGTMRPSPVVMPAPVFYYDFSLFHDHEDFTVQKIITELADKTLAVAVFPRAARLNVLRLYTQIRQPSFMTCSERIFRAACKARHSRLYSSMTTSTRKFFPLAVRHCTKSYAQTWFFHSGRSRMQEPSLFHSRLRSSLPAARYAPHAYS